MPSEWLRKERVMRVAIKHKTRQKAYAALMETENFFPCLSASSRESREPPLCL